MLYQMGSYYIHLMKGTITEPVKLKSQSMLIFCIVQLKCQDEKQMRP
jgi:hypothetical protein